MTRYRSCCSQLAQLPGTPLLFNDVAGRVAVITHPRSRIILRWLLFALLVAVLGGQCLEASILLLPAVPVTRFTDQKAHVGNRSSTLLCEMICLHVTVATGLMAGSYLTSSELSSSVVVKREYTVTMQEVQDWAANNFSFTCEQQSLRLPDQQYVACRGHAYVASIAPLCAKQEQEQQKLAAAEDVCHVQ